MSDADFCSVRRRRVRKMSDDLGLSVTAGEAAEYASLIAGVLPAYDAARSVHGKATRRSSDNACRRASRNSADNPPQCLVCEDLHQGEAAQVRLAGKRIAIKDSVMVAGVPMAERVRTCSKDLCRRWTQKWSRVSSNEGGEIVGKTTCEYLCLSGGSHTSSYRTSA